ncbi:MAG: response regulator, partial [Bryobacteraceae bacterium]
MNGARVLIVDDEPGIRQSLSGVLEDEGCQVTTAPSGEQGLDLLREGLHELVFLDIWLPEMDGMEVLSRIQEMPLEERPAVVMISGHGTIETAVRATKLGAFDFL